MQQLQKYKWPLDTIRKMGKISLEETSDHWEHNKGLSDYKPLNRATFSQWKDAIFSQFGKIISCQRTGGYLYCIENHKNIYEDELKKHMLNSFALTNLICENLSLKGKILVSKIPSAHSECKFYYSLAASHKCLDILKHQFYPSAAASGFNMENHHNALADTDACAWIAMRIL